MHFESQEQKTSAEPIVENKVLHVEPDADVSSDSLNPNVMVRSASEGNYRSPNDSVSSTGSEPLFQEGTLAASESMIFSSTTSISLSARRRTFGIINETKEIVEMFKDVNYEVPYVMLLLLLPPANRIQDCVEDVHFPSFYIY